MAPSNLLLYLLLATATPLITGQPYDYPTANVSTSWTNNAASLEHSITYVDGSVVRVILLRSPKALYGPSFAAGFCCASAPCNGDSFLFAVFIVYTNSGARITNPTTAIPQVVWSANRLRPVGENATLQLTGDGDLILRDPAGGLVWSSGTARRSVAGMVVTELGNLVLFDQKNATVWQSFDHPTDALVPGQSLLEGMRLSANASATNWTQNQLYLTVLSKGLYAYVESTPPQLYFSNVVDENKTGSDPTKVTFTNGSLNIYVQSVQLSKPDASISLPEAQSTQYMRFESDGHLRLYEWSNAWTMVADVIKMFPDNLCSFPTVCGEYGVCTGGQCSCPFQSNSTSSYFKPVDQRANLGCTPLTPISCQEMQYHEILTLVDVSYFDTSDTVVDARNRGDCKQACLKNCSCKAVIFRYGQNDSDGDCYWAKKVFSLQSIKPEIVHYNSSAYLKVQLSPSPPASTANKNKKKVILGATVGGIGTIVLVVVVVSVILYVRRKRKYQEIDEEFDFDQLTGMPARFSYEMLRQCTEDFSKKLGEGGFGSVFEGRLDQERVAVKRLDSARQGKKEFLAEVETIGSIDHINLVKLVGFCAEKSHRLLVYEYMPRGSLDRWIYNRYNNAPLDWGTRCRIILDIAKGLCYLHEECRRKIAHLDIKPQNILLGETFNAKLADFGLSKLIDRDQSKVMTVMRGTPGYLAPEWLTSQITEKVDIYSFGVVVIEIICGRKNIDTSQPEESIQLISLLQEKAQNDQLIDMIDTRSDDMISHEDKVIQMMKLAMWCLQNDSSRRPLMSTVIKVLEGTTTIETCIDYNFFSSDAVSSIQGSQSAYSAPPPASVLSGPR